MAHGGDARQRLRRRALTTLGTCATVAAGYWQLVRPRLLRWGATAAEAGESLPGDEIVDRPRYRTTRAVTISASPTQVWPWLAQIGYRRGRLYSYDWLDRVFGFLDRPSADRIMPEFQHLTPGDAIPLGKGPTWPVHAVDGESRRADERRQRMDTRRVAAGLGIGLALTAYGLEARPRLMTAGATDEEVVRQLPGDDIVPPPAMTTTHAITIDAPPEAVWPWLMQMGPGRGGVYTYDWIENLMGLDMHSADRIHPELQDLAVGNEFHLSKSGPPLRVEAIDPQRTLLLAMPDRTWSWVFFLEPAEGGRTRLIERNRMPVGRAKERLRLELMLPGAYLMERKMLRGIKARAEQERRC